MTTFHGPPLEDDPDAEPLTLGSFLAETVARHSRREAVVHHAADGRLSWTYEELLLASRNVARSLIASGIGPGDRVALLMGNTPT
jgi:fatty-acyl-CoA synthase